MLIFDIKAKFASFKKFYTNSSSMTYIFPPRTTLEGIIGAIIGYDFDSYYEKFNFKNTLIATSLESIIRTYISNLNYIKIIDNSYIKNIIDDKGYNYTQIPFEFLLPENFSENIIYRIYFFSKDKNLMEILKEKVIKNNPVYPVSLGNANMLASLNYIANGKISKIKTEGPIEINSPAPIEYIKGISSDNNLYLQKDIFPVSFDTSRYPKTMAYVFNNEGKKINVFTDKPVIRIDYNNIQENILFPEVASNEFLFP